MTHEIQLIDESAICESSSFGKGILVFDATSPNPIDTLHIASNDLWNGLTITVAFEFKEFYEQVPMDHNGIVPVPNWVFNHSATSVCPGQIIFTGVAPNLRRIITSLPYVVNGVFIKPPQLYARWPIFSGASRSEFPDIGYSNVIYKAEDERALYQWDVNTSTYEQLVFLPSFADTNTTYKLELDPVDMHKIILYARDIGEEDWRNVGEIETADTVYDDQELRSAVEDVSMLVGNTSVAEQISSAIRALSVPDEAVSGQFITTVTQSDGKVAVSRRALQESDVPALGMGKVNGLQDALDLKATTASVTAVDNKVTQLSGTVGTVQGSVTTLVGNDANKSVRTIANEELAAQLISEGATEALDTLQEIAAWIQHHPNDAAALNSSIAALQAQLNGIETGNGTVKSYVDTAVQDLAQQVNQDIQEIELTPGPQGPQGEPGPTGPQGPPGADGQAGATGPTGADGQDGVSPTVTTETISGGTRVTITDASGAHEFDVMNGQNGAPGADGQNGQNGQDGITPTIGENGNWFLGDTDTGKPSRGGQGPVGLTGATPNITMQVTGLEHDQEPTVSKSGTPEEPVFTVGIPQGKPGKDGVQIDDAAVSSTETWSSRKIIDTLCPEFSVSGNPVTCTPVEGYPLGAVVTLEPKQAGTGDPSPDNVRPISGWGSVQVTRCGKNLLNTSDSVRVGFNVLLPNATLVKGATYTFTVPNTVATDKSVALFVIASDTRLTGYLRAGRSQTFTVPNEVDLSEGLMLAGGDDTSLDNVNPSDFIVELGSTPTAYEPYQGNDYTLTLPKTIYGGTVDAVTGEVQSTYAVLRAEDFTTWGIVDFPNVRTYRSTALPDDADDRDAKLPVLCDKLAPSDEVTFAAQEPGSIYRLGRVLSVAVEKDEAPEETAARYGAISVAYTLKTPRAFIATGAQPVFALPGKNTLLTDGDSLTVSGRSDPTAYIQQQISDAITAAVAITGGT